MKLLPVCFILLLLLSSCSTTSTKDGNTSSVTETEKVMVEQEKTLGFEGNWELFYFEKSGEDISIVPDTAPNIIGVTFFPPIDDIYQVEAFTGVNLFSGKADIEKENRKNENKDKALAFIDFSIANDLKTGPSEHNEFELIFKDVLFTADKISLDYTEGEESLIIRNTDKDSVLKFKRLK